MRITLLGSGNVATHMGAALKNAGHQMMQVWSRNPENAAMLAYYIGAEPVIELRLIRPETDLVIIAVKDDAITSVAAALTVSPETVVVHTSGATNNRTLSAFRSYGAFYPLQTFSKSRSLDFWNVPLFVEGNNPETTAQLLSLGQTISNQVQGIDAEKRRVLHVAGVFASNFPNFLYNAAAEVLHKYQLDFNLVRPLILETALKVQTNYPNEVQTGPAIRKDTQTMLNHFELLKDQPELQNIYRQLSQLIVKMDEASKRTK
ncbi:MAG: Rossmann-like and DUF2520 domain-containing protein [Sphingobacteriaceae bacterium]